MAQPQIRLASNVLGQTDTLLTQHLVSARYFPVLMNVATAEPCQVLVQSLSLSRSVFL